MEHPTDSSKAKINPFDQLLLDCQNDPNQIQARYETHRSNRNAQFREKLLDKDFTGWQVDEILSKLVSGSKGPNGDAFADHRHNLNLYARPPQKIRDLIAKIQEQIRDIAPTLWFTPPESLHITTLEITSSRTQQEIDALASRLLADGAAKKFVHYISHNNCRPRLVKPMVSYDASAMALSFVPATGQHGDTYSYHHLRRDLAATVLYSGVGLAARYVVPSAHVTFARFVSQDGFLQEDGGVDRQMVAKLVERIEKINQTLRERYWPDSAGNEERSMLVEGEWVVGQEQGLEFNKGTSWYGGGDKVLVGSGLKDE